MVEIVINIDDKILSEEVKITAIKIFHSKIAQFLEENNIKTLKKIIIPNDFSKEITDFQRINNLPIEHTSGPGGKAAAKTFRLSKEEQIIFYDKDIFARILIEEEVGNSLLFHELSHIYYYEVIGDKYKGTLKLLRISLNILDNLNEASYVLWEEYFVSRMLVKYYPNGLDSYVEFLISEFRRMKECLQSDIEEYKKTQNTRYISGQMTLLSKYITYSLGMIAGLRDNYNDFCSSKYNDIIKNEIPEIYEIWNVMSEKFNILYNDFPELDDSFYILDDITSEYLKLFECFDIKVKINEYDFCFEIY